jgi:hypothetical protein
MSKNKTVARISFANHPETAYRPPEWEVGDGYLELPVIIKGLKRSGRIKEMASRVTGRSKKLI